MFNQTAIYRQCNPLPAADKIIGLLISTNEFGIVIFVVEKSSSELQHAAQR
jgi:hypothetical protein